MKFTQTHVDFMNLEFYLCTSNMDGLETKAKMKEYTLKRLSVNGSIPVIKINGHASGGALSNGDVSNENG